MTMSTDKSQSKAPQAEQESKKHDIPTPPHGEHGPGHKKPLPFDDDDTGSSGGSETSFPDPSSPKTFV
jgi:hypothetical protein